MSSNRWLLETKEYPSTFYRGLSSRDFIYNGLVLPSAFQFDDEIREDGYKELSINWNDDDHALELLLNQRKENGKLQFTAGAAQLELDKVKMILATYIGSKDFQYERHELPGNIYHGNLLASGKLDKRVRSLISNGLALVAGTSIISRADIFSV